MTTSAEPVAERVQAFLTERTGQTWERDTDLFAAGGLSSMFAMELVVHLESTFDIVIAGPDLALDNFRTVDTMTALVLRLREAER
ncbi:MULTISPECIES: acyl carrier protein [Streptomyces]|uniref:acyl carrier protein n=1 Tax=Streptomyces TaxID=1883 RepID=UPI001CCAEC11|nr:acyl carrier protein [Streptomyces olivaceus]MBZ6232757.1 acyl carrier protein [Streptomyces olivaceus]